MNFIPGSKGMNAAGQYGTWGQNNTFIPDTTAGTTQTAAPAANGYTATPPAAASDTAASDTAAPDTAAAPAGGSKGISWVQSGQAYALRSQALPPDDRANLLASVGVLGGSSTGCITTTTSQATLNAKALLAGYALESDPGAMSDRIHKLVRNQYANLFVASSFGGISCAENSALNAIANIDIGIGQALHSVEANFKEKFMPYNKHIGSTLVNLNNVLKDPIGHGLTPAADFLMRKINPHFAESHAGAWLNKRMEDVQHLPGALYGSLRHMQDALTGGHLFGPVQFVKDLYLGAIAIMKAVGKLITDTFKQLQGFVLSMLDDLLGGNLVNILTILDTVSSYLSIIGSVAGVFGGLGQIANIAGQLNGMLGQFSSILSNPLGAAMRFMPPIVGQGIAFLNNPQALLANLPPPFNTIFCILNTISGQGYSGNLGYALASLLGANVSGALASIMSAFKCITPMLGNLLPPSQPYTPPTYPYKFTNIPVPGRPGYLYDSNGNVVKDPCSGPPLAPYDTDDAKSTANAPSTTSNAEAQAKTAGGDGVGTKQVTPDSAYNNADRNGNIVDEYSQVGLANPPTPAPADTSSTYDNANRDGNLLDAYSTVGQSSNPIVTPGDATGPGTTPVDAAPDYPKAATPAAIQAAKDNLAATGAYDHVIAPNKVPGVFD
jgi:hypothetical protein